MNINRHIATLGVLMLLGAQAPRAQGPAQNSLASVQKLKCVFSTYSTVTWLNGEPHAEVKPANVSMMFDSIDTQDGTAEITDISSSSGGVPYVTVRLFPLSLHIMAITSSGAVYITTVFSDKESRAGGKLKAVHSRHEFTEVILAGYTSRPEQYYGQCEILK
jgi:hypothetical protein